MAFKFTNFTTQLVTEDTNVYTQHTEQYFTATNATVTQLTRQLQGAAFNDTHFDLAIMLVWVVGGVDDNGGWVSCGLGFSEQWNVGTCSSAYFVWNSSC